MSLYTHIATYRTQSKEPNMQEIDRAKYGKPTECGPCDHIPTCKIRTQGCLTEVLRPAPNGGTCCACYSEADTNTDALAQAVITADTAARKAIALTKLNMNTCFGCAHADKCFLSPVTGLFTVRFPQGDANCIAYDLYKHKEV